MNLVRASARPRSCPTHRAKVAPPFRHPQVVRSRPRRPTAVARLTLSAMATEQPRVSVTEIDQPRVSVMVNVRRPVNATVTVRPPVNVTAARETTVLEVVDADEAVVVAAVAEIVRVSGSRNVAPTETAIAARRAASKKSTPSSSPADAAKSVMDAHWAGISCAYTSVTI